MVTWPICVRRLCSAARHHNKDLEASLFTGLLVTSANILWLADLIAVSTRKSKAAAPANMDDLLSAVNNLHSRTQFRSQQSTGTTSVCAKHPSKARTTLLDDDGEEWGPFEGPPGSQASIDAPQLPSTFSAERLKSGEKTKKICHANELLIVSNTEWDVAREDEDSWSRDADEEEWDAWAGCPEPLPSLPKSKILSDRTVNPPRFLLQNDQDPYNETIHRPAQEPCPTVLPTVKQQLGSEPRSLYSNPWDDDDVPAAQILPSDICVYEHTTAGDDGSGSLSPWESLPSPATSLHSRQDNRGGEDCFANPWDDGESPFHRKEGLNHHSGNQTVVADQSTSPLDESIAGHYCPSLEEDCIHPSSITQQSVVFTDSESNNHSVGPNGMRLGAHSDPKRLGWMQRSRDRRKARVGVETRFVDA